MTSAGCSLRTRDQPPFCCPCHARGAGGAAGTSLQPAMVWNHPGEGGRFRPLPPPFSFPFLPFSLLSLSSSLLFPLFLPLPPLPFPILPFPLLLPSPSPFPSFPCPFFPLPLPSPSLSPSPFPSLSNCFHKARESPCPLRAARDPSWGFWDAPSPAGLAGSWHRRRGLSPGSLL